MPPSDGTSRACWRCGAGRDGALVCPSCGVIQPVPPGADLFSVLGLPRGLAVDTADLERRYHEASRTVHTDRHQRASDRERELSLAASAVVNRAYRTLRDPVARGRYWLELHGTTLGAGGPPVPPELAAEVFETQETLEALRTAGSGPEAAERRAEVVLLRDELAARLDGLREALVATYDRNGAALDELKQRLTEIAYLRTLLGDIEETLGEGLRGTDHRH